MVSEGLRDWGWVHVCMKKGVTGKEYQEWWSATVYSKESRPAF